mgnify:CR=1 FL=1
MRSAAMLIRMALWIAAVTRLVGPALCTWMAMFHATSLASLKISRHLKSIF